MSQKYTLYGSEFSLYSGKVRSYLRKKGIPYEEVLSTAKVYKEFIVPRTGVQYIPVVQTPENVVLQDTTTIIDELEKRFPENSAYPSTPKQKLVSLLLELYGDEWLLIPAMHYRWNFKKDNYKIVTDQFGAMLKPKWPKFLQGFIGRKVASRFQGAVQLLGIHKHNRQAIEAAYIKTLADLEAHFSLHDFLLGNRPSIADFGFIGPFYAHLYRDPYPGKIMRRDAPAVTRWVERMLSEKIYTGNFLDNDEIPETLFPILTRMAQEQIPVILDVADKLTEWKSLNPDTKIPRRIGEQSFTVEGVSATRKIFPYCLWMYQRPKDYYFSLTEDVRNEVDELLSSIGLYEALNTQLSVKLERKNNRLVFE